MEILLTITIRGTISDDIKPPAILDNLKLDDDKGELFLIDNLGRIGHLFPGTAEIIKVDRA